MLVLVFSQNPVKGCLNCSRVCTSRDEVLSRKSSLWRDIIFGRNANCYNAELSLHVADFIPLPHVEEVRLTPAIPLAMNEHYNRFEFFEKEGEPEDCATDSVAFQMTQIPLNRLRSILNGVKKLKKIDLSHTWFTEENAAAFRYIQVSS